jgi:hypothetical protein
LLSTIAEKDLLPNGKMFFAVAYNKKKRMPCIRAYSQSSPDGKDRILTFLPLA